MTSMMVNSDAYNSFSSLFFLQSRKEILIWKVVMYSVRRYTLVWSYFSTGVSLFFTIQFVGPVKYIKYVYFCFSHS